jgi:hypothetical protein
MNRRGVGMQASHITGLGTGVQGKSGRSQGLWLWREAGK